MKQHGIIGTDETLDVIEDVQVIQKKKGHRVTTDSLLLARFSNPKRYSNVLELGTGCGIVTILMAKRDPSIKITAVEIQKEMAEIAKKNVLINELGSQISVVNKDIKDLPEIFTSAHFDYIVTNPPYWSPSSGRRSPHVERALSRKEFAITIEEILRVTRRLLKVRGRLSLIYIAERLVDLFSEMRAFRIEPKTMRCIYTGENIEAGLIWVEGVREGRPGLKISGYNRNG